MTVDGRTKKLTLTRAEIRRLNQIAKDKSHPYAEQTEIILKYAATGDRELASELSGFGLSTVNKWCALVLKNGLKAFLNPSHPGRRPKITKEEIAQIVKDARVARRGPKPETCRSLARKYGYSFTTISRILKKADLASD